jgi:NADH dehydrogenase
MSRHSHVVVLGGTGFVGRHLVARLQARGHRVTVLSRNRENHRELWLLPDVRVASTDVYSVDALASAFAGADAVINLVGILNERGFSGAGFRRAHVDLTRGVIAAMKRAGATRLLQMSALNAGRGDSHYLKTRGEAEALVKASDLGWTIFEPSVIFGPGDGLFCRFAGLLRIAPVLPLARPRARFAPVYVGDVVEAMARALDDEVTLGKVYQLGGSRTMTLREIVAYTRDTLGLRRAIVGLPDFLGRLQALAMDFVPGRPFSSDNYKSLKLDSAPAEDGLAALGVPPTPVDNVVPRVLCRELGHQGALDRYRQRVAEKMP